MNPVQVELWQLLVFLAGLLISFFGFASAAGKLLLRQINTRLDERFNSLEVTRSTADQAMKDELRRHTDEEGKAVEQMNRLERDFMAWRAEMPIQYVRREDYIRGQSVIEAKLDALFSELKYVQIKGNKHDS